MPHQDEDTEEGWVLVGVGDGANPQDIPAHGHNLEDGATPYGSLHYSFCAKEVPEPPPQMVANEREAAAILEEILKTYRSVLAKQKEIGDHLRSFKRSIGVQEKSEFPSCFKKIQQQLRRKDEIKLTEDHPPQIVVQHYQAEPPAPVKGAIEKFNGMMHKSQEFLNSIDEAVTHVGTQLKRLEEEPLYLTQGLQKKWNECKNIPAEIQTCAEEVRNMMHDVVVAKDSFVAGPATGLKLVVSPNAM